jgi:hypothetical protein
MLYVTRVEALRLICQAKTPRVVAALLLSALACARTGLYPGDLDEGDVTSGSSGGGASAGQAASGSGGLAAQPLGGAQTSTAGRAHVPMEVPACEPAAEACNGRDDDCNGAVDDLPAEACPGGGFRFCVAGRLSECPRRCEVCVPGSWRVCQNSFCTFWGEQECAADGQGFGHCREADPPVECAGVAKAHQQSSELEQCCVDNGYCCLDEHDLDGDGNRKEMLGECRDVNCQ